MNHPERCASASRPLRAGSLLLLFLLLALSACGSSATDDEPPAAATAPATAPPAGANDAQADLRQPTIARVEPPQRARFALLRTPPEGLPADVRRILRAPIVGMNWKLAQRLPVNLSGAYWLVPGRGHLCVVDQGSLGNPAVGTTCARTRQALANGVASTTITRPAAGHVQARLIVGVAPDGTREVRVHTRGTVASAPVAGSMFVVRDTRLAPPDRFSLH